MKGTKVGLWSALAAGAVALGALALVPSVAAEQNVGASAKTAKIGEAAPRFTLKDTEGKEHTLADYTKEGKIVVLEWFNSECPVCARHAKAKTMIEIADDYEGKDVVFLGINSGAPGKQGYGKDAAAIEKWGLNYPVLQDAEGTVGRAYGAQTTPHMFIIDAKGVLRYAGAIDNDSPRGSLADEDKVNYVRQALDEILAGETVSTTETKAYGCNVKYAD